MAGKNRTQDTSVVIPAFKAAATIVRTIASCLKEVPAHHIIVVMDGPDSGLEAAVRGMEAGVQLVILPQSQGACACRNTGLRMVRTRYVMFLDADDYVEDGFLHHSSLSAIQANADLVLGRYCLENPDGARVPVACDQYYSPLERGVVMKKWLLEHYTPPCAIIWRSDFVRSLEGWDESLAKNQDGDLIFRALVRGPVLAINSTGCGIYSQDDNPARITRKHSAGTIDSQLRVLEKIRIALPGLPFDPSRELAFSYYNLARLAFNHGFDAQGERAEASARALGLTGHIGSRSHRAIAAVLGLAGKQRFVRKVRSWAGRLKAKQPLQNPAKAGVSGTIENSAG